MRHVIHGGSKVCFETRLEVAEFYLPPLLSLRGRFRVSFLPSKRGLNVDICFDVPLPSHRGPKLESEREVLDFEFVGIPALPFRCANFHRFLKLTIAFSVRVHFGRDVGTYVLTPPRLQIGGNAPIKSNLVYKNRQIGGT
ncbi:hypothetical protein AVEN_240828-1 [Araneus ventricosus]|uniref:Uncharacterized protein n=1 Tax=Araneus ventricosus TaxID=182803 RepID=A0A4Y2FQZ4_ARAVE|nr:hypothetical protein AVEN_240828-1 [Araneus ventricosus]